MSEIGTKLTLLDIAKMTDPSGKILPIAEILAKQNEILQDMPFVECNDSTGHIGSIRTGLPTPTWRLLNYGVQPTKSTTAQVRDVCGMLEDYAECDKSVVARAKNPNEARFQEDLAHLKGMNQEMASSVFYGNTEVDKEKFTGLAPRFDSLSAGNGGNILNAGGSDEAGSTSIWLVVWGKLSAHAIYPVNSIAGLDYKDLGEVTLEDSANGKFQGYRSHFKWDVGLHVKDWRYVVRIANIDVSALTKDATAGADLIDLMSQAVELPPSLNMGNPVFYCNKTIRSFLRRQVANKENVSLTLETAAGKKIPHFDEVPIKRCDAILNTEAAVS